MTTQQRKIEFSNGQFVISCPFYSNFPDIARDIERIPTAKLCYETKKYLIKPARAIAYPLQKVIIKYSFDVSQDASDALKWLNELPQIVAQEKNVSGEITLSKDYKQVYVKFSYSVLWWQAMQTIPRARYLKDKKYWQASIEYLQDIISLLPELKQHDRVVNYLEHSENIEARPVIEIKEDLSAPIDGYRKFFPHQIEAIKEIVRTRYMLLADDMGLGKTLSALIAAKYLSEGKRQIIVVQPASLSTWEEESENCSIPIKKYSWAKIPDPPENEFILILDEGHFGANLESQRTQKMITLALSNNCAGCIILTGTPMKNGRAKELFPLLRCLRHPLAKRRKFYEDRYCVDGGSNLGELHMRITKTDPKDKLSKKVIIRRTKDILNLPPKTRLMVPVKMSESSRYLYNETFEKLQKEYRQKVKSGKITEADALVLMLHLRLAGSLGKLEHCIKIARDMLNRGEQIVIFTEFRETANSLASALQAGLISGDVSNKQIKKNKEMFQNGILRCIVSTFKRGGVGHTLTAGTTVILLDRPWTPGDAEQAEDRIHRIGQVLPCRALWLQATRTDLNIDKLLCSKSDNIDVILTGGQIKKENLNANKVGQLALFMSRQLFGEGEELNV